MVNYEFSAQEIKWLNLAKKCKSTIVLPEAYMSDKIVEAGLYVAENKICDIVFLVQNDNDLKKYDLSKYPNVRVVNINTHEMLPLLANGLYIKRKDKGMTLDEAKLALKSPLYFATMMVELGLVDGSVSGICVPSKDTFKPAFQIIKCKPDKKASSFFIMIPNGEGKTYLCSDCAIMENPTSAELADIAIDSANSFRTFVGKNPLVAMLSYSTKGSGVGESADKIRKTVEIMNSKSLDFMYDGELQLDSAICGDVAKVKCPKSKVAGKANVLIFPDLSSGNIGYKIMQRFGGYKAIGPIVQGLNKPVNDLSRGASVSEIITTIAITVLQSKNTLN